MKIRHLLIFSLILLVLALGAVSAAEDMQTNQNLTADDSPQDMLEETQDNMINSDGNKIAELDGNEIEIDGTVNVDTKESVLASIYSNNGYIDGSIDVKVDDENVYHKVFNAKDKETLVFVEVGSLKKIPSFGIHNVNFIYQKKGVDKPYTLSNKVDFTYTLWIHFDGQSDDIDEFYYDYRVPVNIVFPNDTKPKMTVTIDGKTLKTTIKGCEATVYIEAKTLKVGTHVVVVRFTDRSKKYPDKTSNKSITIYPRVYAPSVMSTGDKNTLDILATKGTKINATLYKSDEKTKLASFSGVTKASLPLAKFLSEGKNRLYLTYDADGYHGSMFIKVKCFKNSGEIKVSVKKLYDSATVTIKGPKTANPDFIIELDDEQVKNIGSFKKGSLKKVISRLSVGKHKITVWCYGKIKYSKTFFVNVKEKDKVSLNLKKVKVKKSAKKLVLKATLKINKKTKKGLKITFKFNGKKFKAKTNSKGIAKVTVKQKFLKKLEAGAKVKYQAKYGKKIAKRTAKVKR